MPENCRLVLSGISTRIRIYYYRRRLPPLVIRPETTDLRVFKKIFASKACDLRESIERTESWTEPSFIIDGGANVGYASLWFAYRYPDAQIFAVEPDESNYRILEENTKNYSKIRTFKAGLWSKNTLLKIVDRGTGHWGFGTKEAENSEDYDISSMTISDLLNQSGFSEIDILKLDIEGAERELFLQDYKKWLPQVKVLMIELHDRIVPECSKVFYSAISQYKYSKWQQGENIVLFRI